MKKVISLFVVLGAFAAMAAERPLITKSSGGGFVAPGMGQNEMCEVYRDKVVISHRFGFQGPMKMVQSEERKITLDGNVDLLIETAATEKVAEQKNGLCDGPSTYVGVAQKDGDDLLELFSTGGCGTPQKTREGTASYNLMNMIDVFCPTTFRAMGAE